MKMNRVPKILKNSIVGIIASLVSTISTYLVRIIMSRTLGEEIYGVNSIFVSIVNTLLIIELGMSTAMIIVLYQPVIEYNKEKIKSTILFLKKFYRVFCSILFALGIIIAFFFLEGFVNTSLDYNLVRLYFFLYLFAVVFKYLWSYKSCLLYANKENGVVSKITIINTIVFTALQIVCVYYFQKYWIYLILFFLQNILQNVLVNLYTNKYYPYIKEKNIIPLSSDSKGILIKILKPMFVQRIANQIQDSSSVIVLGAIGASAVSVGYFSNYIMLVHACQSFFNQISASFTTSFGNYAAKNSDNESRYSYYLTARFTMSWIATIFSVMYLCLVQPFISIFFGPSYCLPTMDSILLSIYVYIILNSSINLSTQNAVGAHNLDSLYMIFQAVIGIILSVILGIFMGTSGIIVGMLGSITLFTGILKGFKVIEYVFCQKGFNHFIILIREIIVFAFVSCICFVLGQYFFRPDSFLSLMVTIIAIFIIANILMILLNIRSERFAILKKMVGIFL